MLSISSIKMYFRNDDPLNSIIKPICPERLLQTFSYFSLKIRKCSMPNEDVWVYTHYFSD